MLKSVLFTLSLTVSSLAIASPTIAHTSSATAAPVEVDPARLKLAEQTVAKLIPPGTYTKIMKDMMDTMAGGMVEQMMGMDAAAMAGIAGEAGSEAAEAIKGKTMGDLARERDPAFKERMDITMKVMFSEIGSLMSDMEPAVRTALSSIYAKKYSARELADMNTFFATPSGAAFANNFMSSFTDKEMIDASFGMMPKMMEAMPAIMEKVETATAHLPPLPKSDVEMAIESAVEEMAEATEEMSGEYPQETGDEPWYNEDNWTPANRKRGIRLADAYQAASEKTETSYAAYEQIQLEAIDEARKRYLANGWKPDPNAVVASEDEPMAFEDIPANALPPPVVPK